MLELTFGEQVKIVLNRKDMTIKQLAEMIEERTGKKMSRQNLTQRLARDNFQEQDMRLIASILECPFHLSILEENADSEYTTRENIKIDKRSENNIIIDEEPQQLTLNLEYDEPEQVQEEQPVKAREFGISGAERDITIGELVDIHKDLDQMEETSEYADQTEYEEPAEYEEEPQSSEVPEYNKQEDVKDILEEMAAIEAEEKKAREDREEREREREKEQEKEQEKPRGWRAYFPRRKKKQAEAVHEDKQEAATEQLEAESAMNQAQPEDKTEEAVSEEPYQESEEYQEPKEYQEAEEHQELEEYQEAEEYQESEPYQEEEQAYEEYVEENQQDMEEEFADTAQDWEAPEEENVGDINPYTGMEYESNSVRMHPKRIGYVQVYDRSDHQWTDMTEWAFLGYQERKKALLGKDYEPPIYLD
ncbi:hypothetical protein LI249_08625 [Dorea formicigenerans]|uniref:hypothetical protein n=1 Tax=Dorea formicigenerans TaxID=39486 RepID=UPI001D075960|nr:hypothetical protein [Dorea formicigenerans]MCC3185056.1 hypothetical protein [[Clostridium] innocuum]MCB6283026.1 hypothetical protein [Dorea formicigenerans]MCB6380693.1 hypothetical protein [Dorea formicigenerans]MCB6383728.1 hypothetical protein [Dorea formicigenerans]MCB6388788.1 hypothetical protein [Dorea formicigenerans]